MSRAEVALQRISASGVLERAYEYDEFVYAVEPLLREIDADLDIGRATIEIVFSDTPTASAVARALDETDRQARRVVAGLERGVRPETLRGRGVRLVPRGRGLLVDRAEPGSLDLVLVLGGLYQAVTSQPLSFALNFAALLDYGRAAIRVEVVRDLVEL